MVGNTAIRIVSRLRGLRALLANSAGQSELRYRDSGWWKHTWKTDPEWQGTCRELVVEIDQGATERLLFDFR